MFKYKYNKIHIRLVNRILENIDKRNEKYQKRNIVFMSCNTENIEI